MNEFLFQTRHAFKIQAENSIKDRFVIAKISY